MTNILIPNDFSDRTLRLIKEVSNSYQSTLDKLNIILFHSVDMPNSITELLFLSTNSLKSEGAFLDFKNNCNRIQKSECPNVSSIRHAVFYGSTKVAFRNFIEANFIDTIAINEDYQFCKVCDTSYDPTDLIMKSGAKLLVCGKYANEDNITQVLAEKFVAAYSLN